MGDPKVSAAAVEVAGRNWLTAQLLIRGYEVAVPVVDRGVDLIVFREVGEAGIRALPLQLKCASTESFDLDRKYAGRGIPLVYIWNALTTPCALMLTYEEAVAALGVSTATNSWKVRGRYSASTISTTLRPRLEPYAGRWDWLATRLDAQPASGG